MGGVPIIELRGARASRGEVEVLSETSLSLEEGTTVFFMGNAGSGKSTLLKIAAGIRPTEAGEVLYRGRPFSRMSRREEASFRKNSGFVFQDAALWANQSLFDNLALPLRVHESGWSAAEVERAVRRAAELVGYGEDLKARPAELSSGERRLIGLARALAHDPELLFMDEPAATLDEEAAERVLGIVAALKARGRTLVVVSARSDFASSLADRIGVIKAGRLLAFGSYDEALRWEEPAIRSLTGRLRPRGGDSPPAWAAGLAGAWARALTEEADLPGETGLAGPPARLGDLINRLPDLEEIEGGEDAT
jgi:phospholipid/cholesterol/gamma-HCH transport system ATP-binding protein